MQRSTVLFLLVGCTVAAVVAIIAFSSPGDVVAPPGRGNAEVNGVDPNGGNGGSGTGTSGDQSTGNQSTGSLGPVSPDDPHVRIIVTSKEQFVPPPHAKPLILTADGVPRPSAPLAVTVDRMPLYAEVLAGVGAGFDADHNRRGVALISIEFDGGRLLRQIAVDPSAPSPARVGARVVLRGKVLDVGQKPIPGATVWLGELAADGSERVFAVDEESAFEADVPAGAGVPFVVRAPGFASIWRTIRVAPISPVLTEILHPATSLSIQLASRADRMQSVRIFVLPRAPVSTGVSQWPFFRQCLSGGYTVNDKGQAVIDDLPQHGTVGVVVRHPLAASGRAMAAKLTAQPVRVTVPVAFAAGRQIGVVADTDGNAIASASVWLRSPNQRLQGAPSSRLLPPHLGVRDVCFAATDPSGQFEIGLLDEEQLVLSVRAMGYAGRDVSPEAFQNTEVVLPAWIHGEAALRIQPPTAGEAWRVSINLGDGITENCAADVPFVIVLPHAGRFDVAMVVEVDGKPRGDRDVKDLMVTGPIDLVTPAPQ
ncbi:MAG: hypothetical protein ACI89X_002614 [Planctomycetota bacterium]|jgi:hypothetical protein